MGVITEEARHWADRDYPPFEMQVTATDIAKFAHATGETNPNLFRHGSRGGGRVPGRGRSHPFSYVVRMHASALVTSDQLEPDGSPRADVRRSPPAEQWRERHR